jgi:hypothetical protein
MLRAQSGHRPYARLHEIITDCAHPEHRETLTWCGGRFDPEAFNLDRTNRDMLRFGCPINHNRFPRLTNFPDRL